MESLTGGSRGLTLSGLAGCLAVMAALAVAGAAGAQEPAVTTFTITDEVQTADIMRFGINMAGDAWHSGAITTKERIPHGGFEGMVFRQFITAEGGGPDYLVDSQEAGRWAPVLEGAHLYFVNGPRKGAVARITRVEGNRYTLDREGPAPQRGDGVIVHRDMPETGFIGQHGSGVWVFTEGDGEVRSVTGDVPPGSRGRVVAQMSASGDGYAEMLAPAGQKRWMDVAGTWRLRFMGRGEGELLIYLGDFNNRAEDGVHQREVELTPDWQRQELVFHLEDYPFDGGFCVGFRLRNGTARLDELSFRQDGHDNPTVFRDPVLEVLRDFNPGVLRRLQMNSTLDSLLLPREARPAHLWRRGSQPPLGNVWPSHPDANGTASTYPYGLHEFLELCEEIGTEPYYCLPGATTPQEMERFIEYLNGPPDTPYGRIRARKGRPEPWTTAFERIHVEIGNEAWWTYRGSGYMGPDYPDDLFAVARCSPHFSDRIVLHAGGWAARPSQNERVARLTPNADAVGLAPYLIHRMSERQAAMDTESCWSWVFGNTWHLGRRGWMAENYRRVTEQFGHPLSVYEVNHHITGGDAPDEARNRIVASIGGGLNVANWMLMMMAEHDVRVQNLFSLIQFQHRGVRLWGTAISFQPDQRRYRPTFLACMLANRVLFGDMVRVRRSGADPHWTCREVEGAGEFEVPYLHAYATRDDARRGLIVINLHRTEALPVRVNYTGGAPAGGAEVWRLEADDIEATNEPEGPEQVHVVEDHLAAFPSGTTLRVRPFSMVAIRWQAP